MRKFATDYGNMLLGLISITILAFSFFGSDGFFLVDEFVYYLSAQNFADSSSWVIENGFDAFGSQNLVFFNLVAGPNGLVSQYPVGSTILGAPLVHVLGVRGLILVNAASAVGMIFLTRSVARSLFRDEVVALLATLLLVFCTYFVEFAIAIWPHALSSFLTLASIKLFLLALEAEPGRDWKLSGAAGLLIGLAFLVRTDALLIVPAFGAVAMLYCNRPVRFLAAGGIGLFPAFAVAAWANWHKFGNANPISYGAGSGGISVSQHQGMIYLSGALLALLVLARHVRWQSRWSKPVILGGVAGLAVLWYFIPSANSILNRYAFGAYNLLADLTLTPDRRAGVMSQGNGTVAFWGLPKKALGQSLPWLPALLWVFLRPWGSENRRSLLFCLIALALWTMPFFLLAWHGGLGSNMRYFHSILPLIAILGALAITQISTIAVSALRPLISGYALGIAAILVWTMFAPTGLFGAHQVLSTYVLLLVTITLLVVSISGATSPAVAKLAVGTIAVGLGVSTALGLIQDLSLSQLHRNENRWINDALAGLPTPSLIIGPPEDFAFQIPRPDGLLAYPAEGKPVDIDLIEKALDEGYDVYVSTWLLPGVLRRSDRLETKGEPLPSDEMQLIHQIDRVRNESQSH